MVKKEMQPVVSETLLDLFPPKGRRPLGLEEGARADIVELNPAELQSVGGGPDYFGTMTVK